MADALIPGSLALHVAEEPAPRTVVLVEGRSDRLALEALAFRCVLDEFLVVEMHGASNLGRFLDELEPGGARVLVLGDYREAPGMRRSLASVGVPESALYVCDPDLEAELIRALGPERVESVIAQQGDLRAFRSFQRQPAWRDAATVDQLRRFFGSGSGRKIRYSRLLAEQLELPDLPEPLHGLLQELKH